MRWRTVLLSGVVSLLYLAAAVQAQVTLKPKLEPGARYKTQETTKVAQSLKLNGADLGTSAENKTVAETVYRERDGEGNLPVETKIESLVTSLSLPAASNCISTRPSPTKKPRTRSTKWYSISFANSVG